MEIQFKYGKDGLVLSIPDEINVDVRIPPPEPALANPLDEIYQACLKPHMMKKSLLQIFQEFQGKIHDSEDHICIVVSDGTRPVPSKLILQAIDKILQESHIPDNRIKILLATGLHRKATPKEMKQLLGIDLLSRFDIINHVASDMDSLTFLGKNSSGSSIYLNSVYLNAKIKIITGYVEPHFFAGFSGGRKSIVPGIAGQETISFNHSAEKINSEFARFGSLKKNPIYLDAQETMKMKGVKPNFVINVCINPSHEITKVAAGAYQIHDFLVQYQRNICFFPIRERYDVVVSGNGGYPLDLNLYQAVKSMVIGELGVKPGGTIISINECQDSVGQSEFEGLLNSGLAPSQITEEILSGEIDSPDQWEIQVLARVLDFAEILVISSIPAEKLGNIGLKNMDSFEAAVEYCLQKHGKNLSMLILPEGPQYLPHLDM
ncbi:MAG: nickel-dependent lactate racemase [Promethearchaeota archaeon]